MKSTIKTVITVLAVLGCGLICLISFGVYLSETEYMEYDIGRMVDPVLVEARAEYIGENYGGEAEEGYSYYRVRTVIENNSNIGLNEFSINLHFENAPEEYYYIREIKEERPFDVWKEGRYFPAGKTADYYKIVCVENECNKIDVVYENYETKTEQRIHITL